MAFFVEDIASTVLEAINKIGSLANGPVLAVFALGIFTKRANGTGAITGLLSGFAFNLVCWQFLPKLSWLWWNVFGFVTSVAIGYGVSCLIRSPKIANLNGLTWRSLTWQDPGFRYNWRIFSAMLLGWFGFLFVLLIAL
jgi:SSS family solute:Na+ symporter